MDKKLSTIKGYLEEQIKKLDGQLAQVNKHNNIAKLVLQSRIDTYEQVLQVYNQQCEDILKAVGITQERINEHLGYTDRKCIEFGEWIGKSADYDFSTFPEIGAWYKIARNGENPNDIDQCKKRTITTEQLYQIYEATKASGKPSTETGE